MSWRWCRVGVMEMAAGMAVVGGIPATRAIRVECALPVLSQQTQPPYMEGSLLKPLP